MKKISVLLTLLFLSTSAIATEKLMVLLDWFPNPDHAPLFIAKEKGFFKQQDLAVELIGPADPADPPKWVAAEKADIAITYQPQFLQQVDQGLPVVLIGTLINKPLNCIVVLKNSTIHTPADLKGKRIGYSNSGVNAATLKIVLKKYHLTLNDVETINIHYNLTQALLSQKVDAVTGMMRNFEIAQLELAGHPGRAFYPEKNGIPTYSELIFIANKKHLHDPRFQKFFTALQQSIKYLKKHPEESWKSFAKMHPESDNELNRRTWFETLPYFTNKPQSFDMIKFNHFKQFMYDNGLIKKE